MTCKTCGQETPENESFCTNCGAKITADAPAAPVTAAQTQEKKPEQPTTVTIPRAYKPLSPWAFYGMSILFHIPILDFVLLIVFSTKAAKNLSLRNYARSHWCRFLIRFIFVAVIAIVLTIFGIVFGISAGAEILDMIRKLVYYLPDIIDFVEEVIMMFY